MDILESEAAPPVRNEPQLPPLPALSEARTGSVIAVPKKDMPIRVLPAMRIPRDVWVRDAWSCVDGRCGSDGRHHR